jgi:hypothetical protein
MGAFGVTGKRFQDFFASPGARDSLPEAFGVFLFKVPLRTKSKFSSQ